VSNLMVGDGRPGDLRVTVVQTSLAWEAPRENLEAIGAQLATLPKSSTDLVILPEMFTTGFTMRSQELAESMEGPTLAWMQAQALHLDAALFGSVLMANESGLPVNRGLFVPPVGAVTVYDKRHLFRMAGEDQHFVSGQRRRVALWRGWRLLLQICYDLRFPVFSRNQGDYDAVLYVANWPAARRSHWNRLLPARAIENLAYVVGVNRVGIDGRGIEYSGDSIVLDPLGEPVGPLAAPGVEGLRTETLERERLEVWRESFPAHLDADGFTLCG